MRVAPALLGSHAALAATLWARPGAIGIYLWYVGPSAIALAGAACLAAALWSALRRHETWNRRRLTTLATVGAAVALVPLYRTYPSSHDSRPSAVRFRLPLDGPVTVAWGGATSDVNYHVVLPDQRWAYDLLVARDGRSHRGRGEAPADYYAFDLPVRAPAPGVVVRTHDGEPDLPPAPRRRNPAFGNHVVLQVAEREFLYVAHLRERSIAVAPGDRVAAGDVLGRVGNSGSSSEPHVHLHLQDAPRPFFGEGIPFYFRDYRVNGRVLGRGMPRGGVDGGRFEGDVVEDLSNSRPS
jgi:murein DD-endopeptidase MepM/ murein hydrolase activator NlpD